MSSPSATEQPDQVMQDTDGKQPQTEEAPVRRTTINDLPPEIVLAIVEQVDLTATLDRLEREAGRGAGHNAAAGGAAAGANGGAGAGGAAAGAGGILVDLMNNLLGGAAAAAGRNAAPAGGAAQATGAAPAPAQTGAAAQMAGSDDDMPPLEAIPAAATASAARPAAASNARPAATTTSAASSNDVDDMPPLEPIDGSNTAAPAAAATPAAPSSRSTGSSFLSAFSNPLAAFAGLTGANRNSSSASSQPAAPTPAATGAGDENDDDMPPLEPIDGPTPASTTQARSGTTASRPAAAARNDDDDDMPPLEPIDAPPTRPAASSARAPAPATAPRGGDDDDDDMPPLEPIDSSSRTSARMKKSGEETEDDMPVLEPIDSQRKADKSRLTATPAASSTATANPPTSGNSAATAPTTVPARAAAATSDSDDELPPLEPIDDASPAPRAPAPAATTPAAGPTAPTPAPPRAAADDDDMPPLEPIDDATPAAPAATAAAAAAPATPAVAATADVQVDAADDGDWEDDDDDDHAFDEEAEEVDSSDDESDDERLFPDGLPVDPIVPLALVNRPFLHAARKVLYQSVVVPTPYVASLVRDTLARSDPIGFVEGDEVVIAPIEDADGKTKLTRNVLCKFVKNLNFMSEVDCTLGRGGGQLYIDLIRMCAEQLEVLVLRPMFFKSATKPLLAALSELHQLKGIDFNTSADQKRPFMVTTPRVYKLMQRSWPDLEQLIITALRPAEDGPDEEEYEMWDIVDDVDEEEDEDDSENDGSTDGSDGEQEDKSTEKDDASKEKKEESTSAAVVRKKPRGLKDLQLYGFNVQGSELDLILQDSKETLRTLALQRPGYLFKRDALAETLLTFGQNLTTLELILPANWDPVAKLAPGQSRPPFPHRPKDYKKGEPSKEFLGKIGRYTYVLDAVMQCLPNLTRLRFDGPYASAHVFAWMPPSLKTVSFGNCPTISPSTLNKVLNKTYTRTKEVKRADGTIGNKSIQTKAASGLTCLTVTNDDLSWSETDIYSLQDTLSARDCCLHLSSDGGHAGLFPIFGGVQLGGLFGLGGVVRPGGAAAAGQARPPAAGAANFGAGLA